MLIYAISKLANQPLLGNVAPRILFAHTKTCPARKMPVCPAPGSKPPCPPGETSQVTALKRGEPGKVRLGFIPKEWFTFFHNQTGVTGPYLLGILLANYLFSKELYVLEHDYYLGLSVLVIAYFGTTRLGPEAAKFFDAEVDAVANDFEKGRKDMMAMCEKAIKDGKDMQMRANGQKTLMDAKKENVAMQLEAAYRERLVQVYNTVKGRMEYHVKRNRVENRVHQKLMLDWILDNVKKSITPELEKQALNKAIADLAALAGKG